ncbi:hypothetical protein C8Q74DRAFT_486935 [Fomes fomentarius]|nr:hypothetical protein C8Q74DRAFT_486935 [Fomes fomentarius]
MPWTQAARPTLTSKLLLAAVGELASARRALQLKLPVMAPSTIATSPAIPRHLQSLSVKLTDGILKPPRLRRHKRSSSSFQPRRGRPSSPLARNVITLRKCGCITERFKPRFSFSTRDEPAVRTTPCREHISDWSDRFHDELIARFEILNQNLSALRSYLALVCCRMAYSRHEPPSQRNCRREVLRYPQHHQDCPRPSAETACRTE